MAPASWKRCVFLAVGLWLLLLFTGCSGAAADTEGFAADGQPTFTEPETRRTPPPVAMPEPGGERRETRDDGGRGGVIDMSNAEQGYVAVEARGAAKAVLQVSSGAGPCRNTV